MILREGSKKCHSSHSKDRDWAGKGEYKQALENREIKGICTLGSNQVSQRFVNILALSIRRDLQKLHS